MLLQKINRTYLFSFALFLLVWIFTFLFTEDRENWIIENLLVIIFLPLLYQTRNKMPFQHSSYILLFTFLFLHVLGSMYAYASVPLGYELQTFFQLQRNPYDRLVHFSFGLLLAYPLRDMLQTIFRVRGWRSYVMPVEIILSLSAVFELIEWIIGGVLMPDSAETYVGTQGDIWDAQKDMALATFGALLTMSFYYAYTVCKQPFISSTSRFRGRSF